MKAQIDLEDLRTLAETVRSYIRVAEKMYRNQVADDDSELAEKSAYAIAVMVSALAEADLIISQTEAVESGGAKN